MPPRMEHKVKEEVAALNLGNKIRNLRKQRVLTLQEVSDLTGLSKPLLSQIENNIAAPPIATLIKISTALGVKISHFFRDQNMDDRIVVVKKMNAMGLKNYFTTRMNPASDIDGNPWHIPWWVSRWSPLWWK